MNHHQSEDDLLTSSKTRERQGVFFTPPIWVKKSQEYLEKAFGEDWQETYIIWDCCAGTGNLLKGLLHPEQIWASTLDESDVEIMKENGRLYASHIFQFDFLNDSFEKLPDKLKEIVQNSPEKLIIYINPPYAESSEYGTGSKSKVNISDMYQKFKDQIGFAVRELFAQFITRIQADIPRAKLALFSKMKYIISSYFIQFRTFFKASYQGGFVVRANTFDKVKGNFPIGFLIWDLSQHQEIDMILCDVLDNDGSQSGTKAFHALKQKNQIITHWLSQFYDRMDIISCLRRDGRESQQKGLKMNENLLFRFYRETDILGYLRLHPPDFQHNSGVYWTSKPLLSDMMALSMIRSITKKNLLQMAIYLAVRHCIPSTWLNDRDQFLTPNEGWKHDLEFQHDCLILSLFHTQNRIVSLHGINHWIPFRPSEVGSRDDFTSNFMSTFLKGRDFSPESQAVLNAGREIWRYYHANNPDHLNAGLYEIREYFRGRTESGRLRSKSDDLEFQQHDDSLKDALNSLTEKIVDKVYEYEFLKGE